MEPTITVTLGSLYTAILAICTAVTAVSAAVAVVANIVKKLKSPDAARDKKLAEHDSQFEQIDRRLKEYDSFLRSDKTRIEAIEEAEKITQKFLLALGRHEIDGNHTRQLEDAMEELEKHLINK